MGCHPIGMARHDDVVQVMHRPAGGDEFAGQEVEQWLVYGRHPRPAEIVGRGDDAGAEVPLPDPVCHHPRRERVPRAGKPPGQGQPTSRGIAGPRDRRQRIGAIGEDRRHGGLDLFPRRMDVAAMQDERGRGGGEFHGGQGRIGVSLPAQRPLNPSLATRTAAAMRLAVGLDAPQETEHRVIVALTDRIVLVVVAAGAADREPEERRTDRHEHVVGIIEICLFAAGRFIVPLVQPEESGGDDRIPPAVRPFTFRPALRGGPFVAGDLFEKKLVVRFVMLERTDHVVAIPPRIRFIGVPLVAVGLRVADPVEPVPSPAFTVVMGAQEVVDQPPPGIVGRSALEGRHRLRLRRQPPEIERCPADQLAGRCRRAHRHTGQRLQPPTDEDVDRFRSRTPCLGAAQLRHGERLKSPIGRVLSGDLENAATEFWSRMRRCLAAFSGIERAVGDPLFHAADLVGGERDAGVGRRHAVFGIRRP